MIGPRGVGRTARAGGTRGAGRADGRGRRRTSHRPPCRSTAIPRDVQATDDNKGSHGNPQVSRPRPPVHCSAKRFLSVFRPTWVSKRTSVAFPHPHPHPSQFVDNRVCALSQRLRTALPGCCASSTSMTCTTSPRMETRRLGSPWGACHASPLFCSSWVTAASHPPWSRLEGTACHRRSVSVVLLAWLALDPCPFSVAESVYHWLHCPPSPRPPPPSRSSKHHHPRPPHDCDSEQAGGSVCRVGQPRPWCVEGCAPLTLVRATFHVSLRHQWHLHESVVAFDCSWCCRC